MIDSTYFEKKHTKELIGILHGQYSGTCPIPFWAKDSRCEECDGCTDVFRDIRKILDTREHVPNKKEGRAVRQERAKNRHRRNKNR